MSDTATEPQPPTRRGLKRWGWALIAFAALVVLSLPILGFFAYVSHSVSETSPDQPFVEGPAQQPDAASPLVCPERCFELDAATLLAVSAEDVSSLSIEDERYSVGAFEPSTVAAVAPNTGEGWLAAGGDEECAFVPANAPFIAAGPDSSSEDGIMWIQTWETGDEVADIAARVFPTSEDAAAFVRDLHERVSACPWQDLAVPTAGGLDTSLVQITAQAAISVPSDVAAVGWVREGEPGPRWRSYVWDLQRGNLVVQVRVLTDGRILEQQTAAFAELVAERLAELQAATL
ncbi:hypothetical protein HDC94_001295 [Leifsonia sp. AK011]|uniref:sensor domain-containing protein n=1 Tax=Leifsonia sp. AK011 TaxID=2723075 RepID=UPI0015C87D48|nr:sensor domain-containing protein [Leifsonia sp. AK011]NYF10139.1 hypothetical protein [Leifsonia sp. AK011]